MKQMINKNDFINHILETYSIDLPQLERLMDEFQSFYDADFKEFIQQRHCELKNQGMLNEEIYPKLLDELKERRFKAPELSLRQIRRIIYG